MKKRITQAAIDALAKDFARATPSERTGMVVAFSWLTGMELLAAWDFLNKRSRK